MRRKPATPKPETQPLNERQEIYLKAIYAEDQAAKKHEAWRWNQGYSKRPAVEGWLLYADLAGGATPFLAITEHEGVVDVGTGLTFSALKRRGLIDHRERFEPHRES